MTTNLSGLKKRITLPREVVQSKIYLIRSQKIMLDRDLAALYGVTTKALNQAVKRNSQRFPKDFMFLLTSKETADWRSQYVTSNQEEDGAKVRWEIQDHF